MASKVTHQCEDCGHTPHAAGDCATFYPSHPVKCMCAAARGERTMEKRLYVITAVVEVGGGTDAQVVPWLQEHVKRNAFAQSRDVEVVSVDVTTGRS